MLVTYNVTYKSLRKKRHLMAHTGQWRTSYMSSLLRPGIVRTFRFRFPPV